MLSFIPLISLIANVLMQSLGAAGVVSPATSTLVTGLAGGVLGLLGNLAPGQTKVQDVLAVLAGLSSILATLKADTSLPADKLTLINNLDGEVQAAIKGYITAGHGFDASLYSPVATV